MTVVVAESCIEQNHEMLTTMNVMRQRVKALEQQARLLRKERDDWRTLFRKEAAVRGHVLDVLDENHQLKVPPPVHCRRHGCESQHLTSLACAWVLTGGHQANRSREHGAAHAVRGSYSAQQDDGGAGGAVAEAVPGRAGEL